MRIISNTMMLVVALPTGVELSKASEPLMDVELSEAGDLPVDWGEWPEQSHEVDSTNTWSDFFVGRAASTSPEENTGYGGSLYHMVDECALRLELRSVSCGEGEGADEYRMPFMESGDLPCGFQTRMTNGKFEDLASRFKFHFIGDSTTRRLAESFLSIATGEASTHQVYHSNRKLSSGSLQVMFHWAPYCSGAKKDPGVSTAFKDIMSAQEEENEPDGDMRNIFVTAFGVWDAVHGSGGAAALSACTETVTRLAQGEPFLSAGAEQPADSDASPPPLVFLLQNNPFLPGSEEDSFLSELHQVQREVVENDGGDESQAEVYIVHDKDSLYDSMSCYRIREEIHFSDPVKLVEGKMLWDLIALVAAGGD